MPTRPHVLLSCAMSVDGYIDDTGPDRLLLSNDADFDRVDQVRADSDAILVGAGTLRGDDPRLLVRSAARRAARQARGLPAHPAKVTVTSTGDLDPGLRFWRGDTRKIVYCPDAAVATACDRLRGLPGLARAAAGADASTAGRPAPATGGAGGDAIDGIDVVGTGPAVDLGRLLDDLGGRGVGRLMVEGGEGVHTQFLTAGLADELQLVVAPFFVGDPKAPRFVGPGTFANGPAAPMALVEARPIGDVVLLRYTPRTGGGPGRTPPEDAPR